MYFLRTLILLTLYTLLLNKLVNLKVMYFFSQHWFYEDLMISTSI